MCYGPWAGENEKTPKRNGRMRTKVKLLTASGRCIGICCSHCASSHQQDQGKSLGAQVRARKARISVGGYNYPVEVNGNAVDSQWPAAPRKSVALHCIGLRVVCVCGRLTAERGWRAQDEVDVKSISCTQYYYILLQLFPRPEAGFCVCTYAV